MVLKVAAKVAVAFATAALTVACFVDTSSGSASSGGGSAGTASAGPAPTPTSTPPMLVEVDTGKTMTAAPGNGVGVFVEYGAGGKWHVWWTCDTNQTGQACAFDVSLAAQTGTIDSPVSEGFGAGDTLVARSAQTIEASSNVQTNVAGVSFTTSPGAVVLIDASVSGLKDSGFIFFVQDGKVNGGFQGQLTNPLLVKGKTP